MALRTSTIRFIGPTVIEIHDDKLFHGDGDVNKWAKKVALAQQRNIKNAAPRNKRTRKFPGNPPVGHMKASINTNKRMMGRKIIGIDTYSNARYTMFVLRGTKTQWARSTTGTFMAAEGSGFALPRNNYGPFRWRQKIRGQEANNFMLTGMQKTAIAHPSVMTAGHLKQVFSKPG